MRRRDLLRAVGGAAAATPVLARMSLAEMIEWGRAARGSGPPHPALRTLTPRQDATVAALADIIIPETDTPGAAAARVDEFIDLLLTDWFDPEERDAFLAGLADVDGRSRRAFQKAFLECSTEERVGVVAEMDGEVAAMLEGRDPTAGPPDAFFYHFKRLTLTGYYTSEIGMTQELRFTLIPGAYRGCIPLDEVRRG